MSADEGERWGFFNQLSDDPKAAATAVAERLASGPTFAHRMTKTMLAQEWDMALPTAIEAEAQAQAICMKTNDFTRAYEAFIAKEKPDFKGD
jgi:enoyl-CoA hydratase/carnithine racemase